MNLYRNLALVLAVLPLSLGFAQDSSTNPETTEKGRETYLGREIAQTMHWLGAEWLMRESREKEENSSLVRANLGIEPGQTVCDLGCGNGYYTLPFAKMVGPKGRVLAVDIQEEMLKMLGKRLAEEGIENVQSIEGTLSDPKLPPASCDLIVMVDVYHELSHPVTVLAHLRHALKKDGKLALVEFRLEDPEVPIKLAHKMSKAQMITEMSANGFRFAREFDGLPWQHLMLFEVDPEYPRKEGQLEAERDAAARGVFRAWRNADVLSFAGFGTDSILVHTAAEGNQRTDHESWLDSLQQEFQGVDAETWRAAQQSKKYPITPGMHFGSSFGRTQELILHVGDGEEGRRFFLGLTDHRQWRIVSDIK